MKNLEIQELSNNETMSINGGSAILMVGAPSSLIYIVGRMAESFINSGESLPGQIQ